MNCLCLRCGSKDHQARDSKCEEVPFEKIRTMHNLHAVSVGDYDLEPGIKATVDEQAADDETGDEDDIAYDDAEDDEKTHMYKHVIDPFNSLIKDPRLRPSYTAITGSALANGVVTVLAFALKALRRENDLGWLELEHKAVHLLKTCRTDGTLGIWKKFLSAFQNRAGQDIADAIATNQGMADLIHLFAEIVGTYFIARNYESVEPWGKKLNIMDCRLNCRYLPVTFPQPYHNELRRREDRLRVLVQKRYEHDIDAWRAKGSPLNAKLRLHRIAGINPKH